MRSRSLLFLAAGCAVVFGAAGAPTAARGQARPAPTASTIATPLAPQGARRGIVLITVDSLRPDRLGCYTGGARKTPTIDTLARSGVRFERAYTASVSTTPAAASILTGRYPPAHGLRDDLGGRLAPDVRTLAEFLGEAGWVTAAVVGTDRLDTDRGLDRGFDHYDDQIEGLKKHLAGRSMERLAPDVTGRALGAIDAMAPGRPFFLWVHYHDPHYDYDPPEPQKSAFPDAPYDGEVAFVDEAIGSLVRNIRARLPEGRLTFVLAGTHGEALGEQGEVGHGFLLSDVTIRVPLIVVPESGAPAGVAESAPVSLVDVAPTLLALAGVTGAAEMDGRPLAGVADGVPGVPAEGRGRDKASAGSRHLYVEAAAPWSAFGWSPLFGVIEGDRIVIQAPGGTMRFVDRSAPPAGTDAVPAKPPRWAKAMAAEGAARFGALGPAEERKRAVQEAVAAIKWPWDNSPFCVEKGTFPDPRDPERVALAATLFTARVEADQKLVGLAGKKGMTALEEDPANLTALEMLLILGIRNRWGDMLLDPLEILTCNYPYRSEGYHYLGHFYTLKPDMPKALEAFRVMALVAPDSEEGEYDLAATYGALQQLDEAFEHLRRAVDLGAHDFEFIRRDPRMGPLRADPRFNGIIPASGG